MHFHYIYVLTSPTAQENGLENFVLIFVKVLVVCGLVRLQLNDWEGAILIVHY